MLPKVGKALGQFVRPVASTSSESRIRSTRDQERPPDTPKKHEDPSQKDSDAKAKLKLISGGKDEDQKSEKNKEKEKPFQELSIPSAFLNLFDLIRSRRAALQTWIGKSTYTEAIQKQKRSGRFKKGSMFDVDAE